MRMEYAEFVEKALETFTTFLPERVGKVEAVITNYHKNNEDIQGIILKGEFFSHVAPTINLRQLYMTYEQIGSFDAACKKVADWILSDYERQLAHYDNIASMKGKMIFALVNKWANREWLEKVPHRDFLDLAIIYRFVFDTDEEQMVSSVVNEALMDLLEIKTEEELFQRALEDMPKLLPAKLMSLGNIAENCGYEIHSEDEIPPMVIVSNEHLNYGAAAILLPNVLEQLSDIFAPYGGHYFLIPSSVHEMIACPVADDPEDLLELIRQINFGEVEVHDRLSNSAYRYNSDIKKLSIITNLTQITEE